METQHVDSGVARSSVGWAAQAGEQRTTRRRTRRFAMQFILLLWGDEAAELALSGEERGAIVDRHIAFARKLRERGAMVGGDPLGPSSEGALVRNGSVSDGPFAETKEQLGGYYVVEAASRDDAIAMAQQVPASPGMVVEVREIPAV
jgi:hypothetical protein